MAESINLNGPYDTQIPGYDDDADIKKALRLFLYGTNTLPANDSEIQAESIAGYLKALQDDVDAVDAKGLGSAILATQPSVVANGYIWVDSTSSVTSEPQYATASYQASEPSSPTTGALWVDSDSSPYLKMYVWSGTEWREIGA
jgi:hypothetical protein